MATFFEWDPNELSVNVPSMDQEHQILIALMNKLFERNAAGAAKAELGAILTELGQWTVKHFANEEQYMESIDFPGRQQHKLIHENLLTRFTEHQRNFEASDGPLTADFFGFLKLWLSAHIQGIDKKYGCHVPAGRTH